MKKLVLLLLCSFYLPAQNLGRGINLGNMFEAPSETAWGNPFKEEYITKIAEQGFNHIRMPIRWDVAERTQLTAPYTVNPVFLARIKSVVDLAISKNLYVIINMYCRSSSCRSRCLRSGNGHIQLALCDRCGSIYFRIVDHPSIQLYIYVV